MLVAIHCLFLPLNYIPVYVSPNVTFEPCVPAKSSTAPVACGYCREVLAVGVASEESTVGLGYMKRGNEGKRKDRKGNLFQYYSMISLHNISQLKIKLKLSVILKFIQKCRFQFSRFQVGWTLWCTSSKVWASGWTIRHFKKRKKVHTDA